VDFTALLSNTEDLEFHFGLNCVIEQHSGSGSPLRVTLMFLEWHNAHTKFDEN
jgi:hypothetical protein